MSKMLMMFGLGIFLIGLLWWAAEKIGFQGLPGDIHIQRDNFSFHFPIVTCIVISAIISLVLWLVRK